MKIAAALTARILDDLFRLPGVPTTDWADRVARAFLHLIPEGVVFVTILGVDGKSTVRHIEITGASRTSPPKDAPDGLDHLRGGVRVGDQLGWTVSLQPDHVTSFSSRDAGVPQRGDGAAWKRWQRYQAIIELTGGSVAIRQNGTNSGTHRLLHVELGVGSGGASASWNAEIARAVLEAVMPVLAKRVLMAIGPVPLGERDWLTPREELVLWQILEGKKVPQIASELGRSIYTVHDHVKSLHRKLGAKSRGHLVARALGHLGNGDDPLA